MRRRRTRTSGVRLVAGSARTHAPARAGAGGRISLDKLLDGLEVEVEPFLVCDPRRAPVCDRALAASATIHMRGLEEEIELVDSLRVIREAVDHLENDRVAVCSSGWGAPTFKGSRGSAA